MLSLRVRLDTPPGVSAPGPLPVLREEFPTPGPTKGGTRMSRLDAEWRTKIDGIGSGLEMALGILERAKTLEKAKAGITLELRLAREAMAMDNARLIREAVGTHS
jgi:hypothetical protein